MGSTTALSQSAAAAASPYPLASVGAGVAMLGSGAIHATVTGHHYEDWPLAGLFFVGLQVSQTLLGLAVILRWGRVVASLAAAASLGALGVWALSRTSGLPFAPEAFRVPEAVGAADLVCAGLEAAALVMLLRFVLGHADEEQQTDQPVTRSAGKIASRMAPPLAALLRSKRPPRSFTVSSSSRSPR